MTGQGRSDTTARRRALTIAYVDLSGSSRLATAMENEHYAAFLARLHAFFQQGITRYGGTVAQIQGDGVLAVFGYPQAHDDATRRAVECVLDLHAAAAVEPWPHLPPGLRVDLHSGVHAGRVLVHEGDAVAGRVELIGNATIVAVRLADAAASGEILVSEASLGADRHLFETAPARLVSIQGRVDPLWALPVLARSGADHPFAARPRDGLSPFVGRTQAVAQLVAAFERAHAGHIECLAVSGALGSGKTRLVHHFLDRLGRASCTVLRGYCEGELRASPLQPVRNMLMAWARTQWGAEGGLTRDRLAAHLAALDPTLTDYLDAIAPVFGLPAVAAAAPPTGPASAAATVGPALLLEALGRESSLVVFFDDWHWADDATREIVGHLARGSGSAVLIVLATREPAGHDPVISDAATLLLDPLADGEAAALIARLMPSANPFEINEVARLSGGNPLFIEEICHSFPSLRTAVRSPFGDALTWLSVLIAARAERLSPAAASCVRTAAVIGPVVPRALLETLHPEAADASILDELAQGDFVYPGDDPSTLRFKHGITRDVVYDSVGLEERTRLHLAIARELAAAGDGEALDHDALAQHYLAAEAYAEGARYAEAAGDRAMRVSALDVAQAQYRAALDALDRLPPTAARYREWFGVAQKLGLACVFDPNPDQVDVLRRAVELARGQADQALLARAEYWLGYIFYALGDAEPAIAHGERALAAARASGDEPLAVQVLATVGQAQASACNYAAAAALLDEAIEVKRRHRRAGRPAVGLAYTLACRAAILGDQGAFGEAEAAFEEALRAVEGAEHEVEGSVLALYSAVLLWQGRWDEAARAAQDGAGIGSRVRSLYVHAMCRALHGYARWKLGAGRTALAGIEQATAWLERQGKALFTSLNYGWMAEINAALGEREAARASAMRALERARRNDRLGEAMACRALAALAGVEDGEAAERWLDAALESARVRGSRHEIARTRAAQAGLALARGNGEAAERLQAEARATLPGSAPEPG